MPSFASDKEELKRQIERDLLHLLFEGLGGLLGHGRLLGLVLMAIAFRRCSNRKPSSFCLASQIHLRPALSVWMPSWASVRAAV